MVMLKAYHKNEASSSFQTQADDEMAAKSVRSNRPNVSHLSQFLIITVEQAVKC
jgi:hypothetical protein